MKSIRSALVWVMIAAAPAGWALEPCPDGTGPRAAVMGYLTAMHENQFGDAFDFVSALSGTVYFSPF